MPKTSYLGGAAVGGIQPHRLGYDCSFAPELKFSAPYC